MVKRERQNLELPSEVLGSATDALCYFKQRSPFPSLGRQGKDDVCLPWRDTGFGTYPQNILQLVFQVSGFLACHCHVCLA